MATGTHGLMTAATIAIERQGRGKAGREEARQLAGGPGQPPGPLLLALAHSSWRVRAEAVRLLGLSGEPQIELLLKALGQEAHEAVREAIVWSLGRLIPAFLADEQLRSAWLARLRTTLIALVQADDCWLVREAAAWALGRLGWAAPLEALRQVLLSDGDEEVCAAAAQALALSGKRLARAYLLEALERVKLPSLQETIREALAELDEALARTEAQAQQARRSSSPLRQTLLALRDFLEDRRGTLLEPRLLLTEQGPVLVLWCTYQAKERRLPEVLEALPQDLWARASIAPLVATQRSGDRVLRLLGRRLAQHCQQPSCQEVLMLSTTVCRQPQVQTESSLLPEQGCTCLRVIIIGVSELQVDGWTATGRPCCASWPWPGRQPPRRRRSASRTRAICVSGTSLAAVGPARVRQRWPDQLRQHSSLGCASASCSFDCCLSFIPQPASCCSGMRLRWLR
jgi:hypothetical protein